MYYKKIKTASSIIEFHNNWLGEETVIVNGQIVSKKSSVFGTHHYFTLFEEGQTVPYILTTKLLGSGIFVDLRRDGELIEENVPIKYGTKEHKEDNEYKRKGIKLLKEYEIKEAKEALHKGLAFDKKDPEIYFYLACCHSIEEQTKEGYECIKKAVENNLSNPEMILNHEMLAYLRIQDGFEDFLHSNFTKYTLK